MVRKIIIGKVREEFDMTPIEKFMMALRLSKTDNFIIQTNDPQFVESLEVLCGEENVEVYLRVTDNQLHDITFQEAYNYLGDIYDIINTIRFSKDLTEDLGNEIIDEDEIMGYVDEYIQKWC